MEKRRLPAHRSAGGGHGGGVRRGEAVAGPLPDDVPPRGVDRAGGGGQEGEGDLRHRPGHAPALLPRLLRPGLRRLGDDRVRQQRRREGRAGQPVPRRRRLRHRRARQGRRREGLPRRGLLRRRPRPRRQGRRHHVVRPALDGGAWPAGRARLQGKRRHGQAAGAGHAARHPCRDVRRQQPHRAGHGRALGRAHRRLLPLHALRRPALPLQRGGGPVVLQGVVCAAADGGVPARRRPDHRRRHGPRHAHRLRQCLLRQPCRRPRALRLRPGAARRRRVVAHGGGVRQEPDAFLRGVQGGHGQARESRGEERPGRGDQTRLHRLQPAVTSTLVIEMYAYSKNRKWMW